MNGFYILVSAMAILAPVVFVALFYLDAGYGYLSSKKWGPEISNKAAWVIMESPAFFFLLYYTIDFANSGIDTGNNKVVLYVMSGLFLLHYFQRSFIFPFLIRGKSKMSVAVMVMGMTFNSLNSYIIGRWLFHEAPSGMYGAEWLTDSRFIFGVIVFFAGMFINLQSDYIIRHLRKPGDTRHYIPRKGLYKYVTSANYFGELTEWVGYAILTWSPAGLLFAIWTFANLGPRAKALSAKYEKEFGDEYKTLHKKNIIPFIW